MSVRADIPGWSQLVDWFGFEPDFHDAEVLGIDFRRAPLPTTLSVYTWRMTSEVDHNGFYVLDRHATVAFILEGVAVEEFKGWNHQNVLYGVSITRQASAFSVSQRFTLHLDSSFGLEATFTADAVTVDLIPGKIEDKSLIPGQSRPRAYL
jgi:hypothetical protein